MLLCIKYVNHNIYIIRSKLVHHDIEYLNAILIKYT